MVDRYSFNSAGEDSVSPDGHYVAYEDYAELERLLSAEQNKLIDSECHVADLERQRDALVAENAALKVSEKELDEECRDSCCGNWVSELTETPATDAELREIGAKAVEKARDDMQRGGSLTFGECYVSLTNSAQQLREEKV